MPFKLSHRNAIIHIVWNVQKEITKVAVLSSTLIIFATDSLVASDSRINFTVCNGFDVVVSLVYLRKNRFSLEVWLVSLLCYCVKVCLSDCLASI